MKNTRLIASAIFAASLLVPANAMAGEADVVAVEVNKTGDSTYNFSVTVSHADDGWDHYANSWEVVLTDGRVLATRVLAHPHVDEQPFTRSKGGVNIPPGVRKVIVRAGDSVHGFGGIEMTVELN